MQDIDFQLTQTLNAFECVCPLFGICARAKTEHDALMNCKKLVVKYLKEIIQSFDLKENNEDNKLITKIIEETPLPLTDKTKYKHPDELEPDELEILAEPIKPSKPVKVEKTIEQKCGEDSVVIFNNYCLYPDGIVVNGKTGNFVKTRLIGQKAYFTYSNVHKDQPKYTKERYTQSTACVNDLLLIHFGYQTLKEFEDGIGKETNDSILTKEII